MAMLNRAGRICLAKSVISAMPTYSMQIFNLPQSIVNEVDRRARAFVWASKPEARGWHTLRWSQFILPKDKGGLGVRDSSLANVALIGKLVWSLLHHHHKLWVQVLSNKYLHGNSILRVQRQQGASYIWRGILNARDQLRDGFQFRIGDGHSSFWHVDWTGHGPISQIVPFVHYVDSDIYLKDVAQDGVWNVSSLYTIIDQNIIQMLPSCPMVFPQIHHDAWVWEDGMYSAKSAYMWLLDRSIFNVTISTIPWRKVWKLKVSEKVRVFLWFALHNALPLNEKRYRIGLSDSNLCMRCSNEPETLLHSLRDCTESRLIWDKLGSSSWRYFSHNDPQNWLITHISGPHAILFAAAVWSIWRWRNSIALDPHPWSFYAAWRFLCHQYADFVDCLDLGACYEDVMGLRPSWSPPPRHAIKLNVDGSFNPSTGATGIGGVIRDADGRWLRGFYSHVQGQDNALFAEVYSLKVGLEQLWSMSCRTVICEVDCSEIINILRENSRIMFHTLRGLFIEIQNLLRRSWSCKIEQVSREANYVADWLAKYGAHNASVGVVSLDNSPLEVEALLLRDSVAVV